MFVSLPGPWEGRNLTQLSVWVTWPKVSKGYALEKDLGKLLLNGSQPGWKSSPDASYLSGNVGQLCVVLFKTCKNGVFSSKKFKAAIEKLAAEKGKRLTPKILTLCFWIELTPQSGLQLPTFDSFEIQEANM